MEPVSPRIVSLSWGRIEVEGLGGFKDVKLWPGGGREWDWNETGTRHTPGIQPADVEELIGHGAEVIVLTRGMQGALGVSPDTLEYLTDRGVRVHVHSTEQAVDLYNRLRDTSRIGGLFHSTC